MDDLSTAFDDEFFGQEEEWAGAEDEAIEEGNTLEDDIVEEQDKQDAAEAVEAFQPADDGDDDIEDEEGDESLRGSQEEQAMSLGDAPSDCIEGLQELEELAAEEEATAVDSTDARASKRRRTTAAARPDQDAALLMDGRDGGDGDAGYGMDEDADIELPCSQGARSTHPSVFEGGSPVIGRPPTAASAATAASPSQQPQQQQQQQQQQCEHPTYWAGMCVCCGALKPEDDGVLAAGGGGVAEAGVGSAGQHGSGGVRFKAAGGARRGIPRPSLTAAAPSEQPPLAQQPPTQTAAHPPGADATPAQVGDVAPQLRARRNPPKQAGGLRTPARASGGPHLGRQGVQGPGMSVRQQHQPEQLTRIKHLHERGQMEVSKGEAMRVRQREVARLLNSRRLVLILDLDHTLLHSVRLAEVPPDHATQLEAIQRAESGGQAQLLHCLRLQNLWTKLRPGVYEFLEACRGLFEMHIYTMGDRSYAAQIRALLDPQRKLFSSVISQNDSTSTAAKNLDVALADDRIVLILDDTEFVWPHHRRNLIQVERYHFFPGTMRPVDGVSGLLDLKLDESSSQGTLASVLGVLQDVHSRFFGSPEGMSEDAEGIAALPLERRDVRYCLLQRREEILKGCHLCFSHCWPQAFPNPFSHPLWLLAESLGAECSKTYNRDTTTHMVAGSAATEKAIQAKRHGKHVVGPDWLKACMFRWQREDETKYAAAPHRKPQLFMSPLAPLQMAEAPPPLSRPPPHPESACIQASALAPPAAAAAAAAAASPSPPAAVTLAPSPPTPAAAAAVTSPAEAGAMAPQSAAAPPPPPPSPPAAAVVGTSIPAAAAPSSPPPAAAGTSPRSPPAACTDPAGTRPAKQLAAKCGLHSHADAHSSAGAQEGAGSPEIPGRDRHSIQGESSVFVPQFGETLGSQQDEAQHVTSRPEQGSVSNGNGCTHQQCSANGQQGGPAGVWGDCVKDGLEGSSAAREAEGIHRDEKFGGTGEDG